MQDSESIEIRFTSRSTLLIDLKQNQIVFGSRKVDFSQVRGFWKNYVVRRKKKRYYVVLLTNSWMDRITPEIDEYDADEIIKALIEVFGDDKYAR